jgi:hypothetical protein
MQRFSAVTPSSSERNRADRPRWKAFPPTLTPMESCFNPMDVQFDGPRPGCMEKRDLPFETITSQPGAPATNYPWLMIILSATTRSGRKTLKPRDRNLKNCERQSSGQHSMRSSDCLRLYGKKTLYAKRNARSLKPISQDVIKAQSREPRFLVFARTSETDHFRS